MKSAITNFLFAPILIATCFLAACSGPSQYAGGTNSGAGGGTTGPYTIGGTVTGLAGSSQGLVLQDNATDNQVITGNGTFTFKTAIASGGQYAATILTQPTNPAQTCNVTSGSGTAAANVTTIQVACATPNATVSVNVTGLPAGGLPSGSPLVLQDNGNDNLSVSANGTYPFKNVVNGTYSVIVLTQPINPAEICTIANGNGTPSSNAVTLNVTCALSYTISGTVNGLDGTGLTLLDNGTDSLNITGNGTFTFHQQLATGTAYAVSVKTQPSAPAQTCVLTNNTGTVTSNVINVIVTCPAVTYSVGGVVVGLEGKTPIPPAQVNLPLTDNSFVLQNNSGDNFTVTQNGQFTFATPLAYNVAYNVTEFTAPSTQPQGCWSFFYTGIVTSNVTSIVEDCGHNDWTWIDGTKTAGTISAPQYGSFPTTAPTTIPNPYTNTPGARNGAVGWTDGQGNLWLFGGQGWELSGNPTPDTQSGTLNDLWECQMVTTIPPPSPNYCQWQLVNGYSNTAVTVNTVSTTQGPALITLAQHENTGAILPTTPGYSLNMDVPISRWGASSWTDLAGTNLWVFGGNFDGVLLNDLWKYNIGTSQWSPVTGSTAFGNQPGVYSGGSLTPGSRWGAVTWRDSAGNFWLFGGYGYDKNGNVGFLNDLWEYNGSNWLFVSGGTTNVINQNGIYSGSPFPGGRQNAMSWTDASGNFWLFGGEGEDSKGTANGVLNDLWKYTISSNTWTFVAGSSTANQLGVYGSQPLIGPPSVTRAAGTVGLTGATAGTLPGSRWGASTWTDFDGTLWLFGGWGLDSKGTNGNGALNDLWAYDTANNTWTWVKGSNTGSQSGSYSFNNTGLTRPYKPYYLSTPGGRSGATSWVDNTGQLWLFGGQGNDAAGNNGFLNDLWRYVPYP